MNSNYVQRCDATNSSTATGSSNGGKFQFYGLGPGCSRAQQIDSFELLNTQTYRDLGYLFQI
jgi:hypothetical protein